MNRIEIYTKGYCGFCSRAKMLLDGKGLDFVEYDVEFDRERYAEMLQRAPGRRTVPQIFIDGQGIGGYTELAQLMMTGELERRLNDPPASEAAAG